MRALVVVDIFKGLGARSSAAASICHALLVLAHYQNKNNGCECYRKINALSWVYAQSKGNSDAKVEMEGRVNNKLTIEKDGQD